MPKAQTRSSTRKSARTSTTKDAATPKPTKPTTSKSSKSTKGPKASHLYTDDNPDTTLHGTGFKDSDTAKHTIQIVSNRSLTYQFQTINTMYHRASHHPHRTPGIEAAMAVFREWLDITYPNAKKSLRAGGFRPVLSKDVVRKFTETSSLLSTDDMRFANLYVDLERNKRLANVLLDEKEPGGKDWERERYERLCALVPDGKEDVKAWEEAELWEGKKPTKEHLRLIAWGWSPVPGRTLASK